MEKPFLVVKPNIVNAIIPLILKNGFKAIIFLLVTYGIMTLLERVGIFSASRNSIIVSFVLLFAIFTFGPVLIRLVVLGNTTYSFYKNHVLSEFKFIYIKRDSVPYDQIVNIKSKITLWDRWCKAGDVILHTAEDEAQDLTLHYIDNPERIEKGIYKVKGRMRKTT